MKIPPLTDWKLLYIGILVPVFLSSLQLLTIRVGICFNYRSKQTPLTCWYLHINLHCNIFQKIWIFISTTVWNSNVAYMQIAICTWLYIFRYTQLLSFKPCSSTTVLSPDITHHLLREAVNIPVIASLSVPWSTTWMQINNLFLTAGLTAWFFYPCTHETGQVQIYQVLHIIKQYLHWPRFLQVIFLLMLPHLGLNN
jgi:hypothetical protein